jgi:CARDB
VAGTLPKASEGGTLNACGRRSRDELLSPKVWLLLCVLLATSLFLAVDHSGLIKQELSGRGHRNLGSGSSDSNRPIGSCVPVGNVPRVHHGSGSCPLNFVLSLSQGSLIEFQGSTSLVGLSLTLVSGVSVSVTLSAHGAPDNTQILFAPASARPSFSSTMTITTSPETPLGQFNITILATGGGVEKSATFSLLIIPVVHDIAVVSATVQSVATVGNIVSINATVANYGSVSETFELRAYANTSFVAKLSTLRLDPSAIHPARLMWNTTGYSPGTYKITVAVPPVQGELNLLDNSREAGKILLTQTPGSRPCPSPSAPGGGQGFSYGRQLAILVAIVEVAIVFLVVLRSRGEGSSGSSRKI